MWNAKSLAARFLLALALFVVPVVAAEGPSDLRPMAPMALMTPVGPVAAPPPIFLAQYVCTCEVEDPCTVPLGFVLIGGYCNEGQGCRCSGRYDAQGCLSGSNFECTGNSES